MKKIYSLVALIWIMFSCWSQNYQTIFGNNSTSWYQARQAIDRIDDIYIQTLGDTTIEAKIYKKLYVNNQINIDSTLFIREDTVEGKVWVLDADYELEYLVMDLSLEKADTFKITTIFDYQDSLAIVDSVYIVEGLKHIEFDYDLSVHGKHKNLSFMEGIGPNSGFLYQIYSLEDNVIYNHFLLCSYKNAELTYMDTLNSSANCVFKVEIGIKEQNKRDEFTCFPNPVNDELHIFTPADFQGEIEIYDSMGNTLKSLSTNENRSISIPVHEYSTGLYFLVYKSGQNIMKSEKFQIVH